MSYDLRAIGVDIRDLWRPGSGLSPRHVLWLVGQLPDSSAFSASMRGGSEFRSWSLQNVLLAASVNLLYAANQQRGGKKSIKQLVRVPQPKRQRKTGRVMRVADILKRREPTTE